MVDIIDGGDFISLEKYKPSPPLTEKDYRNMALSYRIESVELRRTLAGQLELGETRLPSRITRKIGWTDRERR